MRLRKPQRLAKPMFDSVLAGERTMKALDDIHVLIVDDEPNMTLSLAASLRKLGKQYVVDTAHTGQEAITKVKKTEYALVITDYKMPGMSGVALVQKIQHLRPQTRIVLMSGHGTDVLRHEVVGSLTLEAYLDKPFDIAQIRHVVQAAAAKIQERQTKPLPPLQPETKQPITEQLQLFRADTAARCVLVLSQSGHVLDVVGDTADLDTSSISALVAANFMAGVELARLLGNDSVFKTSYHEGPHYNIYAHSIDSNFLLAIIFGQESKQGVVRFYVNKLVDDLAPLLVAEGLPSMAFLDQEFSQAVRGDLDELFQFA